MCTCHLLCISFSSIDKLFHVLWSLETFEKTLMHMVLFFCLFFRTDVLECDSNSIVMHEQYVVYEFLFFPEFKTLMTSDWALDTVFVLFASGNTILSYARDPFVSLLFAYFWRNYIYKNNKAKITRPASDEFGSFFGQKLRRTPAFSFLQFIYELIIDFFLSFHILS